MTDDIRHLRLPLSEAEARSLPLGQMVSLSGLLFSGRCRLHIRAVDVAIVPALVFARVN
ncbi:MAG: hypothetical protein HY321_15610, partial [Armatimonadetes bacterium]|nr:hypothetical protein [Armatimonadota bacterium]